MPNAANRVFGSTDGNFDRSAGPVDRVSEGTYSQHTIYMPYTLMQRDSLKFDIALFTDETTESNALVVHRWLQADGSRTAAETGLVWPDNVYSLSHVALPFPPTDSLYGSHPEGDGLHIGQLVTRGERGLLTIHPSDMLRLRYNPFYTVLQQEVMDFIAAGASQD